MESTPIRPNPFYTTEHPHNPGSDPWKGNLTATLQLYRAAVAEQGWGDIVAYNFTVLDGAMLRDHPQVITGINEFKNRVQVRKPQASDEATPRSYVDREVLIWSLLRR